MRDVEKYIHEYNKFVGEDRGGYFFGRDLEKIAELSSGTWDLIVNSLSFGFMVGYKKALRDEAKKRRTCNREKRKPLVRAATLTKGREIG